MVDSNTAQNTRVFIIQGDKDYIDRVVQQMEQHGFLAEGVISVLKIKDTKASIAYDSTKTNFTAVNQALKNYRVQNHGGNS